MSQHNKKVFICEKPSQARDIAHVLGANRKKDGYIEGQETIVTWCLGHLLETAKPEHYCKNIKPWRIDILPIIPQKWHMEPTLKVKKQLGVVSTLIKNTNHIVIATDADREGELIAREIISYCQYKGHIERLWLSALDDASIKKALEKIKPGKETETLYYAGLGRQRADWIVGMNMTMATSSLYGKYGEGVLSVGRVQTPTLQLIVTRDRAIENFKPQDYYELFAFFKDEDDRGLWLKWLVPKKMQDDEAGRCLKKESVDSVVKKINQRPAEVSSFVKKKKKQSPPVPFSLSTLQKKASALYGFSAKKTLSIAQELYEKYKATTYPRTDSGYLPESQFSEAREILNALVQCDPSLAPLVDECDTTFKSPAWNDKKVTAHHGIIPTTHKVNFASMPEDISRIYKLIRTVYIAQFLGDYVYKFSKLTVTCEKEKFTATGNIPLEPGWKKALSKDAWGSEAKGKEETTQDLPDWSDKQVLFEEKEKITTKKTKPLPYYTEGTLIGAMESIGKYVEDPKLKKILKETSGIGTQATRASIIEILLKREFITREKKLLKSTEKGRSLVDLLPMVVKDPATTALWEQNLEDVVEGKLSLETFLENQNKNLEVMIDAIAKSCGTRRQPEQANPENQIIHPCPTCDKPMNRRRARGNQRFFWGCSAYPECKVTLPDYNGKPGAPRAKPIVTDVKCVRCNNGVLIERSGQYGKFYGCSKFPECKFISKSMPRVANTSEKGET